MRVRKQLYSLDPAARQSLSKRTCRPFSQAAQVKIHFFSYHTKANPWYRQDDYDPEAEYDEEEAAEEG
jgi:hypothetical protein